MRLFARHRAPAIRAALEIDMGHHLVEDGVKRGQFAMRVQHEGRAIEDLIVLCADHVDIDQRQAGLDRARHHMRQPTVELAPVVGRAVGHQQDLGPAFGQRLGHVRMPGVLADRGADAQRADAVGTRHRARVVKAHLVEDGLVGQVVLEDTRRDLPALENPVGVVKALALGAGAADADRRAIGAVARQRLDRGHGIHGEGRLHHEVLHLVAGDEHLGEGHEVGARGARDLPGGARHRRVPGDVAHCGVQLRQRQPETVGHQVALHLAWS